MRPAAPSARPRAFLLRKVRAAGRVPVALAAFFFFAQLLVVLSTVGYTVQSVRVNQLVPREWRVTAVGEQWLQKEFEGWVAQRNEQAAEVSAARAKRARASAAAAGRTGDHRMDDECAREPHALFARRRRERKQQQNQQKLKRREQEQRERPGEHGLLEEDIDEACAPTRAVLTAGGRRPRMSRGADSPNESSCSSDDDEPR